MQNGILPKRNVFHRLNERKLSISGLISEEMCACVGTRSDFSAAIEEILLDSRYAAFLEASFGLSDDYEKGLFEDLTVYTQHCRDMAEDIAGKSIPDMLDLVQGDDLPVILQMTLNSLFNGVYHKMK